jgi:hypothetical protein
MVKRRSFMPESSITFTDAEILLIADEEIKTVIAPLILSVNEEYMVDYYDQYLEVGRQKYPIHHRSVGLTLRELHLVDSSNNVKNLTRNEITKEQNTTQQGIVNSFSIRANEILLWPLPNNASDRLRQYFFLRPSNLVEQSLSAAITAFDLNANTIDVAAIDATFTDEVNYDIVSKSGGHACKDFSQPVTSLVGTTFTFTNPLPTDIAIGDHLCIEETSGLVQIPPEFVPILAQAVSVQLLEATSQPGANVQAEKLKRMIDTAQKLITSRVSGEPRTIINSWI